MAERAVRMAEAGMVAVLVLSFAFAASGAVSISDRYRSPRNPERRVRASTELIVLHTTEAPARSSLNKVSDRGECHFCVTEDGSVYRIVDRDREAFHSGRSMWNGKEDVDKFSVGIECVGYHDKRMGDVQLNAIRSLVKELQAMYRIPDERVVCHSHVAYGAPNKWHRFKHRGRKRCGMLFAMPSVRARLGLRSRPAYDPDTRARRLRNADDYLRQVLYGNVDTMGSPAAPRTTYIAAARTKPQPRQPVATAQRRAPAAAVATATRTPAAATTTPRAPPAATTPRGSPIAAAKSQPARRALPQPRRPTTVADLKAQGYKLSGTVSATVTASRIAGSRWNSADTYYVIRGKLTPGNMINAAHIERGMGVWMKK